MNFSKDKIENTMYVKVIFALTLVMLMFVGVSYSFFYYNKTSETQSTIIAGSIYLEMNDNADLVVDKCIQ